MAADTYTSFLGAVLQGTGNNNNSWGTILNGSAITIFDRAIAGNITYNLTGGTLDLSGSPPPAGPTQALDYIQRVSGTLTSHQTIIVPNLSRDWLFVNNTAGAFNLYVKTASSNTIQIPQGSRKVVFCNGLNGMGRVEDGIGSLVHIAGPLQAGYLACNGASLVRTEWPDLFAAIGTTWGAADSLHFTLPLLTDTGRYLRSSTGSLTVGTYQSNTVGPHSHPAGTCSGTTGNTSNDHTHGGSGTTGAMNSNSSHTHIFTGVNPVLGGPFPVNGGGAQNVASYQTGMGISTTNTDHTHDYSLVTTGQSANHNHAFTGTTTTPNNTGTTETRPESAVVTIGIKY